MFDSKISAQRRGANPELEFRRILVPTDFSTGARRALECARSIARKFQSEIHLLHVIPSDVFEMASPENSREALAMAREFAKQQLDGLAVEGESQEIVHQNTLAEGPAWPMISETIKAKQIDLLVVGTHGKSASKKLVLGSVAEKVFRMADCPTLAVPQQFEIVPGREVALDRLLFATNFKPHNERAARVARAFERGQGVQLTVLHVVEDSTESTLPGRKLVEEFMVKRMRKVLPEGCLEQCKPEFVLRFGKPVEEILAAANQLHSNLIFLGLRAAERSAGHLPSAVAYGIVCRSACPVLTIRL